MLYSFQVYGLMTISYHCYSIDLNRKYTSMIQLWKSLPSSVNEEEATAAFLLASRGFVSLIAPYSMAHIERMRAMRAVHATRVVRIVCVHYQDATAHTPGLNNRKLPKFQLALVQMARLPQESRIARGHEATCKPAASLPGRGVQTQPSATHPAPSQASGKAGGAVEASEPAGGK